MPESPIAREPESPGAREARMKTTFATLVLCGATAIAGMQTTGPAGKLEVQAVATAAAHVTGGDVLIRISVPSGIDAASVKVTAADRDVSSALRADRLPQSRVALITGLPNGRTMIAASTSGARGTLEV